MLIDLKQPDSVYMDGIKQDLARLKGTWIVNDLVSLMSCAEGRDLGLSGLDSLQWATETYPVYVEWAVDRARKEYEQAEPKASALCKLDIGDYDLMAEFIDEIGIENL